MLEKNENAKNQKDNIATAPKEEADAEKESEISAKELVKAAWSTGDISEYWEYIYIYV